MNKTAIKNFAIWARNKLIADISYKAGLLGITEKGIKSPLPQSTQTVQFFDIGTKEPSSITGIEIQQRKKLVEEIERKAKQSDYAIAYKNVIEEVAYTWFNRLIAIRFMEVNDYLPTRIRVLSSEGIGKSEPDLVTHALEANLDYSAYERDRVVQLKHENKLDELFRVLFIKQCNALNANLPELFEKTSDYTELLLNVYFTDKEGVVYHLVNDISEDDFNVSKEGQVEIIGWLYQYYNTEPKDETFALLKKNVKITKERIPAATQLFTPDWIVRYMVENSLGRLWLEGHPNDELKANWKYYLDEAEQEEEVRKQLDKIREDSKNKKPEDIKVIDPAMGSGHILVYAFDVLMQIYESYGYSQRDAATSIIENNLYGLDIDNRAYQLAYFAVMMKARQYNRKILNGETMCHVFAIQESNAISRDQLKYFGSGLSDIEKNSSLLQIQGLLDSFKDAKEYGSIITVENYNWELLRTFIKDIDLDGQLSLESLGIDITRGLLELLIGLGETMTHRYDVVVTNPPYMSSSGMSGKLSEYVKKNYPDSKADLFSVFIENGFSMLKNAGLISMITMESWMFLSSFEKLRSNIISSKTLINMTHMPYLGKGSTSLGINFGTAAVILSNKKIKDYVGQYTYIRYFECDDRGVPFDFPVINERYSKSKIETYNLIPGKPIAYWLNPVYFDNYKDNQTLNDKIDIKQGLATGNNDIFLRNWHEIAWSDIGFYFKNIDDFHKSRKKYAPYNKGGFFRKWYGNGEFVIRFDVVAYEKLLTVGNHLPSRSYYFRDGITWTLVSTRASFGARISNQGYVFDVGGSSGFSNEDIKPYLGFLCSSVAYKYLNVLNPTINVQVGDLKNLPFKDSIIENNTIKTLVSENVEISKKDWDSFEISWDFKRHPLVDGFSKISEAFAKWYELAEKQFNHVKNNEKILNEIFINIYGLNNEMKPEVEDKDITLSKADLGREIRSFISYAVGCMFGRYSTDVNGLLFAGNKWDDSNYTSFVPDKDNIIPITDEEYFDDDLVGRFVDFVTVTFGQKDLEENLDFIAVALDAKGNSPREVIRNYFLKDFYKDHCQVYQKRPIYWLFDSGKQNGFKALIYMHRYDENTIGNMRIDYLHRMQRIYENEIGRMQDTIENSKDAREVSAATKRKEKLIKQLQETKEYDEKIAHLALARTSIDLDDGVKVNYEKVQTDRDGKKLDVLAKI